MCTTLGQVPKTRGRRWLLWQLGHLEKGEGFRYPRLRGVEGGRLFLWEA